VPILLRDIRDWLPLLARFTSAARCYWLCVLPRVREEVSRWRRRALQVPDPVLRTLALQMQQQKVGNIEGATAYAAFARRLHRARAIGAQVAFQTAYDYADILSERGSGDPVANGRALHEALLVASESACPHVDYYAHCGCRDDGGYLAALSGACRAAFDSLPARAALVGPLVRAVRRIVSYQGRNHRHPEGTHLSLAMWARRQTPAGSGLRWWETAASAGSSTGIFSFIAAASHAELDMRQSAALEGAYFPWAGSVHTLLDSLVDRVEDAEMGQRSLLDYYVCPDEASRRMGLIAEQATRRLRRAPDGRAQLLVFAAMASLYVTWMRSKSPADRAISRAVLEAIGAPVLPAMLVFALRRILSRARIDSESGDSRIGADAAGADPGEDGDQAGDARSGGAALTPAKAATGAARARAASPSFSVVRASPNGR
jgi:tetraprenyl-beta-curcumene synthase